MVRIEKITLTDQIARYKYFPEASKESGIVALNRNTGERIFEKALEGYDRMYAAHAIRRIEEYQKRGEFLERDIVAWY